MINFILFIPALIALAMLFTQKPATVLMKVYMPCLMLAPLYWRIWVSGISLDASTLVAVILAAAGIITQYRTLRFTLLDFCIFANLVSAFIADIVHHPFTWAVYATLQTAFAIFCPYYIGRTLIEQTGMRVRFAKSVVYPLAAVAIFSLWEFRMTSNPFQNFVTAITHASVGWGRQMRWGFGRVAGPYGHAIVAGMVFTIGIMFQLWLLDRRRSEQGVNGLRAKPERKQIYILLATLLGVFIAQSRGPWIGCALGGMVAIIGLANNRKRVAARMLTIALLFAALTGAVLYKYTDTSAEKTKDLNADVDQRNAVYRRELIDTYIPMIKAGGIWGWGSPISVSVDSWGYGKTQASIDNEYIRLTIAQGYFGLVIFLTMIVGTVVGLTRNAMRFKRREDIVLAYCLIGAVIASAATLSTVFLGQPLMQLLFMIIGWSESLRPGAEATETVLVAPERVTPFQLGRVYV
jgi:hypothetical protein